MKPKNKIVALILCIFLGYLGIHRFYTGKVGTGILWLVTIGCFGIGWIVDIIMIATGHFRDAYGKDLQV
ncbi:MAG: NINE protein [Massilioclostridium sp.]|nr:MAG: NINE protein [Massilioclostridium sp.]